MYILTQGHFHGVIIDSGTAALFGTNHNRSVRILFDFCLYIGQPFFENNIIIVQEFLTGRGNQDVCASSHFCNCNTSFFQAVSGPVHNVTKPLYIVFGYAMKCFFLAIAKISCVNVVKVSASIFAGLHLFALGNAA